MVESADGWWSWSLSNSLSLTQVLLTVGGFAIAIVQLWRTAEASIESKNLLQKLRVRLIGNDLLVVLPDLHALEDAIDDALNADDPKAVERALVLYSRKAFEVVGLVESDESFGEDELVKKLRIAAAASQKAKSEIAEGAERTLREACALALKRIAQASSAISAARSKIQRKGD